MRWRWRGQVEQGARVGEEVVSGVFCVDSSLESMPD